MKKYTRISLTILNVAVLSYIVYQTKLFTLDRTLGTLLSIVTALNILFFLYPILFGEISEQK